MEEIVVLSLFDGMSCGQLALQKAGIKVKQYHAAEIDKYAIQVTQTNFPDTIQLGDITKWRTWHIAWANIDLVLAGSPCQGFSFAGKGLNFEDERSKLFFVFVEILNHIKQFNPKVLFLLENVQMKYEHELVISRYVGCNPVVINSALLSAQNRIRNYWTNINQKPVGLFGDMEPDIKQPKDKGILLKHILETNVSDKYQLSEKAVAKILRRNWSTPQVEPEKTGTILPKNNSGQLLVDSGTTLIRTSTTKDNLVIQLNPSTESNGCQPYQQNRIYDTEGISPALMAQKSSKTHAILEKGGTVRRLTEKECERLQTVPDNYTAHVSSTQRYKMLGNGWTVDVIAYILEFIKIEPQ